MKSSSKDKAKANSKPKANTNTSTSKTKGKPQAVTKSTSKDKSPKSNKALPNTQPSPKPIEEVKTPTPPLIQPKPVYHKFKLNYIYRRQAYSLKLLSNIKLSLLKNLISKQLTIPSTDLIISYNNKELTSSNINDNIYDMLSLGKAKYFEVKKRMRLDDSSINLSTNHNFMVILDKIPSGMDLYAQVDAFFKQLLLENNAIVEPTKLNRYVVSFASLDLAFDFKRFMLVLIKENKLYENTKVTMKTGGLKGAYEEEEGEKNPYGGYSRNGVGIVAMKRKEMSTVPVKKDHLSTFINQGVYFTYEEIRRKEELKNRGRWLTKKGFVNVSKMSDEGY